MKTFEDRLEAPITFGRRTWHASRLVVLLLGAQALGLVVLSVAIGEPFFIAAALFLALGGAANLAVFRHRVRYLLRRIRIDRGHVELETYFKDERIDHVGSVDSIRAQLKRGPSRGRRMLVLSLWADDKLVCKQFAMLGHDWDNERLGEVYKAIRSAQGAELTTAETKMLDGGRWF